MVKYLSSLIFILLFSLYSFHGHLNEDEFKETKLSNFIIEYIQKYSKYKQANIGAFIISSAPIPIFIIILIFKIKGESILNIFSSFAAGALIGDVFIHNLPEIFESSLHQEHQHKPNINDIILKKKKMFFEIIFQNHMLICWGILTLFIVEKMSNYISNFNNKKINNNNNHSDEINTSNITISLIGDFIHNLTDGMAIGAGFNKSLKLGISLSLSIFFHEIPHEIGDFSYLLKQNLKIWTSLLSQILTGIGTFIGVYLSFEIGEKYSDKIISYSSGVFLYLAVNTIMGDLKNTNKIFNIIFESFAFIFGLFALDIII